MWQPRWFVAALALAVLPGMNGCGLILNGTRQTVEVGSVPEGAQVVTLPVTETVTTPARLELIRKNDYTLTFSREGYRPASFLLARELDTDILFYDIFFTFFVGVFVDAATGAWYKLKPEATYVTLLRSADSVDGPEEITVSIASERDGAAFRIESNPSVDVTVRHRR